MYFCAVARVSITDAFEWLAGEALDLRCDNHPERSGFREACAQPRGVVAGVDDALDLPKRFILRARKILPDRRKCFANVLGERPALPRQGVDDLALNSKPARLEAVERVREVCVFGDVERRARKNQARNALNINCQGRGPLDAQRSIEN